MVHGVTLDAPPLELAYSRPMSIEDWEQMDEDAPGELVDGRLESPPTRGIAAATASRS
jgi:hypothetical protein